MLKPLWAFVGAAFLGTAGVAGALIVTSPGGEEEVVQQVQTATATSVATATATSVATITPTAATTSPSTPEPSSETIPAEWKTYVDPVLGFSFGYPSDLALTDLTGRSPLGGLMERILDVASPQNRSRGFSVSIIESNSGGLTVDEWAVEFGACRPNSIRPGSLGAVRAVSCTREGLEGASARAVVAEYGGRMFLITAGSALTEAEFTAVVQNFGF